MIKKKFAGLSEKCVKDRHTLSGKNEDIVTIEL